MVGNLSILIRKKEINKSRESKEKIARQKAQRGSRTVPLPLGTSQLGYMPRGNPRRRKGRREDVRMRFNKCHRPQVGDVSAPQTRLQGVRFPLDFDNSAPLPLLPPRTSSSRSCPLNERIVGRASVSCPTYKRYARETDTSTLRFVQTRWTRIESFGRSMTMATLGHENFVFGETWTRGRERGTNVGGNYSNPWRATHDHPSRPVSPAEPSCRSMLFNRRAKVTVWKEH